MHTIFAAAVQVVHLLATSKDSAAVILKATSSRL
jgi:hypothetical protein